MEFYLSCSGSRIIQRFVVLVAMLFLFGPSSAANAQQGGSQLNPTKNREYEIQANEEALRREARKLQVRMDKLQVASGTLERHDLEIDKLTSKAAKLNASVEAYPEILKVLQTQRVQLKIDLAGIKAKREAIAEMSHQIDLKSKEANRESLEPLTEMLAVQVKQLERLEKLARAGSTDKAAVDAAKMSVLSTRFKIQQESARNGQPDRFNELALNLSLERAEKKARLERTEELLNEILVAGKVLSDREKLLARRSRFSKTLEGLFDAVDEQTKVVESVQEQIASLKEELDKID